MQVVYYSSEFVHSFDDVIGYKKIEKYQLNNNEYISLLEYKRKMNLEWDSETIEMVAKLLDEFCQNNFVVFKVKTNDQCTIEKIVLNDNCEFFYPTFLYDFYENIYPDIFLKLF